MIAYVPRVRMFGLLAGLSLVCAFTASAATVPDAPTGLAVNSGDGAVSLGWLAPANNGGSPITGYVVNVLQLSPPQVPPFNATLSGTASIVQGLSNGTAYAFSVTAVNAVGPGPQSSPVFATPAAAASGNYAAISIPGDANAVSGVFDPSVVNDAGTVWLAYSSVNAHNGDPNFGDITTSIAKGTDGAQTFTYLGAVGQANGPVTITDTAHSANFTSCSTGLTSSSCTGRWVYETPWMIKDPTDPDPSRRYKLFAHKYFNQPPVNNMQRHWYWLGAIVMWTASSPDGTWSPETPVLGWNLTPPEIPLVKNTGNTLNLIDPTNLNCDAGSEGSASLDGNGGADFTFSCLYNTATNPVFKVVLLRISNLAALGTTNPGSFQYVSTLLTPADAAAISFTAYSTPALLSTQGNAPVLIATPYDNSGLKGCYVFPFASEQAGTLFRDSSNKPIPIVNLPQPALLGIDAGGGCAWDRGLTGSGIYMNDFSLLLSLLNSSNAFSIVMTKKPL